MLTLTSIFFFFFFNDTATTEIYTLSLHELFRSRSRTPSRAHPSRRGCSRPLRRGARCRTRGRRRARAPPRATRRSEEHTSELQSLAYLVCRLLLEKKNKQC